MPTARFDDQRKVQTAVTAGPRSTDSVFLPFERDGAERVRDRYGKGNFYCGHLLGGCGKLLAVRVSDLKVCHFAHHPPVRCERVNRGEASADHLFIGRALYQWLAGQTGGKVSVDYDIPGFGMGEAVRLRFGSQRLVHVQLAALAEADWDRIRTELSHQFVDPVWMYGPAATIVWRHIAETGYAYRVECFTDKDTRQVRLGTDLPAGEVEWTTVKHCSLKDGQILTPSLVSTTMGTITKAVAAEPSTFMLASRSVMVEGAVLAPAQPDPTCRAFNANIRSLGVGDRRATVLIPRRSGRPHHSGRYVLTGAVRLQISSGTEGQEGWIVRADGFRYLGAKWFNLASLPALPAPIDAGTRSEPAPSETMGTTLDGKAPQRSGGNTESMLATQLRRRFDDAKTSMDFPAAVELWLTCFQMLRSSTLIQEHREQLKALKDDINRWCNAKAYAGVLRQVGELRLRLRQALKQARLSSTGIWEGELTALEALASRLGTALPDPERHAIANLRAQLHSPEPTTTRRTPEPATRASATTSTATPDGRLSTSVIDRQIAPAVRTFLTETARKQTTVTWTQIRYHLPRVTPQIHTDDQGEILVAVDTPTPLEEPALAYLVTRADGGCHPILRSVLSSLGRTVPDAADFEMHWRMEILKLHSLWRHR